MKESFTDKHTAHTMNSAEVEFLYEILKKKQSIRETGGILLKLADVHGAAQLTTSKCLLPG
jgi:hypothetical protein